MRKLMSVRTLLVVAGAVAVFVGGAAFAASSSGSPASSFFDSLAKHLGISSEKLADATKAAEIDQVDAALAAGRITKEQADALKARINSSDPANGDFGFGFRHGGGPMHGGPGFGFGFGGGPGFGLHAYLSTAADYLGLSEQEVLQKLGQGQSLADIAGAQTKSVDGLEQALYDQAKKNLDQAVSDKKITADQESAILGRLKTMIDRIVNAKPGVHAFGGPSVWGGHPGSRWSGPRTNRVGPVI